MVRKINREIDLEPGALPGPAVDQDHPAQRLDRLG
jgi:hypothetical protein